MVIEERYKCKTGINICNKKKDVQARQEFKHMMVIRRKTNKQGRNKQMVVIRRKTYMQDRNKLFLGQTRNQIHKTEKKQETKERGEKRYINTEIEEEEKKKKGRICAGG